MMSKRSSERQREYLCDNDNRALVRKRQESTCMMSKIAIETTREHLLYDDDKKLLVPGRGRRRERTALLYDVEENRWTRRRATNATADRDRTKKAK